MKRLRVVAVAVSALAALALVAGAVSAAPAAYTGTLNPSTQITATGAWASTETFFTWNVKELTDGWWEYDYLFSVPSKNISHMIFEMSSNMTSADLGSLTINGIDCDPGDPGVFSPTTGNSNLGMPSNVFGIKAQGDVDSNAWAVKFTAKRAPVWGDFFAKGANSGSHNDPIYAYNAGFDGLVFDATNYVNRNGLTSDLKIAVPDSVPRPNVPEASTVSLGLMGLVSSGGYMLKRARR